MIDIRICPKCGTPINMADSSIRRLTPAAYHAYHALRASVKNGQILGVTRMASIVGVQPPSMYNHLPQLIAANLIEATPKRQGGSYYVYRLIPQA